MNTADVKLLPYIAQFDEVAQVLEIIYRFSDIEILPIDDPLGLSPTLLKMYRHVWLDAVKMGIKLDISQGGFSDANGLEIQLEEKYLLDSMIPSGAVPDNQISLASVIYVDEFLNSIQQMFVYSSFYAVYRGESQAKAEVPPAHIKVPGDGINPHSSGGWFVPPLMPSDFDPNGLLLGIESFTPYASILWQDWYNAGGGMFCLFHPALINMLRSNFPGTGFGTAPEEVWTFKLQQTNPPDYPACIPAYSILSADVNAHFKQYYYSRMHLEIGSINPNHERGDWASYDWDATINPYYWSHPNHNNCPLACEMCWKEMTGYGEDSLSILREWVLQSYGRPNTSNRDLYPFITSVPETYFSTFQGTDLGKYLFIDGLTLDLEVPSATMVAEWDATSSYDGNVALSHYGGLAGSLRYNDMIILDRAVYFLSDAGITGNGVFSASPINYIRNFRHQGEKRDGVLYLLGATIPDDYIVYYRPVDDAPPGGGIPPTIVAAQALLNGLMGISVRTKEDK